MKDGPSARKGWLPDAIMMACYAVAMRGWSSGRRLPRVLGRASLGEVIVHSLYPVTSIFIMLWQEWVRRVSTQNELSFRTATFSGHPVREVGNQVSPRYCAPEVWSLGVCGAVRFFPFCNVWSLSYRNCECGAMLMLCDLQSLMLLRVIGFHERWTIFRLHWVWLFDRSSVGHVSGFCACCFWFDLRSCSCESWRSVIGRGISGITTAALLCVFEAAHLSRWVMVKHATMRQRLGSGLIIWPGESRGRLVTCSSKLLFFKCSIVLRSRFILSLVGGTSASYIYVIVRSSMLCEYSV